MARRRAGRDRSQPLRRAVQAGRDPRLRAEPAEAGAARARPGAAAGDHPAAAPAVRRPARGDGLAAATITTTITPLRAIYRRARQLGEVQANPVAGLSVPSVNRRQTRFATAEQIEAMLDKLDEREGPGAVGDRAVRRAAPRRADGAPPRGRRPRHGGDPGRARLGPVRGRGPAEVEAGEAQGADPRRAARPAGRVPDRRPRRAAASSSACADTYERGRDGRRGRRRRAADAARVPPRLRGADDRRRRQREGALDVHGPREHQDHARPVRPPAPGAEDEAAGLLDAFLARQVGGANESSAPPTAPHPEQTRS